MVGLDVGIRIDVGGVRNDVGGGIDLSGVINDVGDVRIEVGGGIDVGGGIIDVGGVRIEVDVDCVRFGARSSAGSFGGGFLAENPAHSRFRVVENAFSSQTPLSLDRRFYDDRSLDGRRRRRRSFHDGRLHGVYLVGAICLSF